LIVHFAVDAVLLYVIFFFFLYGVLGGYDVIGYLFYDLSSAGFGIWTGDHFSCNKAGWSREVINYVFLGLGS
jgi:hypothetical protein